MGKASRAHLFQADCCIKKARRGRETGGNPGALSRSRAGTPDPPNGEGSSAQYERKKERQKERKQARKEGRRKEEGKQ